MRDSDFMILSYEIFNDLEATTYSLLKNLYVTGNISIEISLD